MSSCDSRLTVPGAIACILLSAAGCGNHYSTALRQPVGETHTTASSTGGARSQGQDRPTEAVGVVIAEDVRRACDLPSTPHEAPRFDFDSARLRPRGEDVLVSVASCVARNRLGDAVLRVVGYTDPRGSAEYNEQLGLYRATAAKQHLVDLGVPAERIATDSRGERGSRGSDEASWALDRRVEIRLTDPPQLP